MSTVPHVYTAINAVQAELAVEGISKNRRNTQQNFNFRGIDDVYNALSPMLARNKLCILPRLLSREVVERKSNSGGALFSVTVMMEFDLVSSVDGSKHTVATAGEAMDSGDKATNKAMSAAYKYAAFQAFAIPTEGDNDADATTHGVASSEEDAKREAAIREWVNTIQVADTLETLAGYRKELEKQYGTGNVPPAITAEYNTRRKELADKAKGKE